jgi:GTPase SAR1 family protein
VKSLLRIRYSINALSELHNRLRKIQGLLQIKTYDIVFIGQIGVGKTTSICHLLGLNLVEEKEIDKSGEKISIISELLTTGAGRTTICEVVISPTQESLSWIEIEPYSPTEIERFIKEVCVHFWAVRHSKSASNELPPAELLRAIRNIVDLKEETFKTPEGKRSKIDRGVELAKEYDQFNDFLNAVIIKAGLGSRNAVKIIQSGPTQDKQTEKRWLRSTFESLNLGRLQRCSLPQRIKIFASKSVLNLTDYPRIGSIIDTRGMDGTSDRADLQSYIRHSDKTICLFAEKFPSAPDKVTEILKKYVTTENQDISQRLALLVLHRDREPAKIIGCDGIVESLEEGIEIRRNDILTSFAQEKIPFREENIIFYDALEFYDDEKSLKTRYKASHVKDACHEKLQMIQDFVVKREEFLCQEVKICEKIFNDIRNGNILGPEEEQLIDNLQKKIQEHESSNFSIRFNRCYLKKIGDRHTSTFRAVNNRYGEYPLKEISIYFDAADLTEKTLRTHLSGGKDEIIGAIRLVHHHASIESGIKGIMEVLERQVEESFERLIQSVSEQAQSMVKDALAPQSDDNDFWEAIISRWGQGKGYKDEVLESYKNELEDIESQLSSILTEAWNRNFMANILGFFIESALWNQ